MKTLKLILGIISMVLSGVILFQSCAAGLGNIIADTGESSGTAGVMLVACMLIAGIVGLVTRKGRAGSFVAAGFYLFGGLIGIANYGTFADLRIWSILCLIFGGLFIVAALGTPRVPKTQTAPATETEELK